MERKRKKKFFRRFTSRVLAPGLGLVAATVLRGWTETLDYRVAYHDPTVDPVHPRCPRRFLFLAWHEYMIFSVLHRGHCRMTILASQNRDAEFATHAARYLGWGVVRGSSSRGGAIALRRMMRAEDAHLNFTPDGPRGPRRRVAPGAIYLSAKLSMPIVCCGYAYDRPWRANSWDRFAVPRPFSRARAIVGPPIEFPKKMSRDELADARFRVETHLRDLTGQAESWAESGTSMDGEMPMLTARPAPAMMGTAEIDPRVCRYRGLEKHDGLRSHAAHEGPPKPNTIADLTSS